MNKQLIQKIVGQDSVRSQDIKFQSMLRQRDRQRHAEIVATHVLKRRDAFHAPYHISQLVAMSNEVGPWVTRPYPSDGVRSNYSLMSMPCYYSPALYVRGFLPELPRVRRLICVEYCRLWRWC